jgi:chaperonin cofactor prefoldin
MSNAESPRFYDLFRKVASLEKRLNRLEDSHQQLDNVVDPQGWIGEAFKLQEEDLETIKADIKTLDSKLDIILSHLTGINKNL